MILKDPAQLGYKPQRIISLVPSQTELLYSLGLEKETIGITKFCVHPEEWFRNKTRIGGTKAINIEKVASLIPDLIIANKEENIKEQVETLANDFPVWVSDVNDLTGAYQMIYDIGTLTKKEEECALLSSRIKNEFDIFSGSNSATQPIPAVYLIWKDPYMTVGGDTFINNMMRYAGFKNLFADRSRYPETTIDELKKMNCELILLSSEPYPFKQKHIDEIQNEMPDGKIMLVDGEMFSWYGSRLLHTPVYFKQLLNFII